MRGVNLLADVENWIGVQWNKYIGVLLCQNVYVFDVAIEAHALENWTLFLFCTTTSFQNDINQHKISFYLENYMF